MMTGWEVVATGSRLRPGGELGGELGGSSGSGDGGAQVTTHSGGSTVGLATATKAYSGEERLEGGRPGPL